MFHDTKLRNFVQPPQVSVYLQVKQVLVSDSREYTDTAQVQIRSRGITDNRRNSLQ